MDFLKFHHLICKILILWTLCHFFQCFCWMLLSTGFVIVLHIFIRVQNSIVSRIVILWNALEFFWPLYFHIFDCTYMCWSIRWLDVLKYISHNSCLINTQYPPCDHSSFKISYFCANKLWYLLQLKIAAMRNMSSFICLTLWMTKQRLN